jgi:uncharacterized protein (DUF2384 family)
MITKTIQMNIDDILKGEKFKKSHPLLYAEIKKFDTFLYEEMERTAGEELIFKMISTFADKEKARDWYYTNSLALGNKRPYDYCLKNKQYDIFSELVRMDHGIFS